MSSSHHLTILRTSSLTIRENPRKRLGVGQLQILSPVVDSLSNRVNGCRWAVCETAAKLTSCRAAISPLRLCRVWMRPDLTGMLVRLHASKTFVSSRKSRCPPPATRGRLNGWHAVRQMLCIASYHVISIHPTDSVWACTKSVKDYL